MTTTAPVAPSSAGHPASGHPAPARPVALTAGDIDLAGFARELDALKRDIRAAAGPQDLEHLGKIERWGRL